MTTPAQLPPLSPELLAALREVEGVGDVVAGEDPSRSVRLDLHAEADAAAVEMAVSDLLAERFGISGARTETVERMGPVSADGRLTVSELVLAGCDGLMSAEVTLSLDGRTAPGSASAEREADAVVTAILLALEELTEDAVIGAIDSVRVDGDGIARVRLRLDVDGSEEPAEAEAAVLRSAPQAVVRAVLTAVGPHLPS